MELLHTVVELVVDLEKWITHVEDVLSHQPGLTKQSEELHQQLKQLKVHITYEFKMNNSAIVSICNLTFLSRKFRQRCSHDANVSIN